MLVALVWTTSRVSQNHESGQSIVKYYNYNIRGVCELVTALSTKAHLSPSKTFYLYYWHISTFKNYLKHVFHWYSRNCYSCFTNSDHVLSYFFGGTNLFFLYVIRHWLGAVTKRSGIPQRNFKSTRDPSSPWIQISKTYAHTRPNNA